MSRRSASPRQVRALMVFLCAFALLLGGLAFFLNADHIVINGRTVPRNDPGFRRYLICWRIMMGLGAVLSFGMARLCYKIARDKELKR